MGKKIFERVDANTAALIRSTMEQYQQELYFEGVTVDALFAMGVTDALFAMDEKAPAMVPVLKRAGYPAAATIKITSLDDRVRGMADAKMVIDFYTWKQLPEASRVALIDHELQHLMLRRDEHGVKRDDIGRPALKLRVHEWELTGFVAVAERHREAAVEVRAVTAFMHEQLPLFSTG